MKFTSEFFKTADDLVQAKNAAVTTNSTKKTRMQIIRKSRGLSPMVVIGFLLLHPARM